MQERYLTVGALTRYIEKKFEVDPYMQKVFVKGEISNLSQPASGHIYFTLKDKNCALRSVIFFRSAEKLQFNPSDGMNVLITGKIAVFTQMSRYQLYVESMEPDGMGALYLQFEQLKEKLEKEGLFSFQHKKKLPSFPSKIAVITSQTGAAVRDILTTLKRRMPIVEIIIYPTVVQGNKAAKSIAKNIARMNARGDIDIAIIGRGGGSLEELFAFNEEIVVRSIYDSDVPIISAVGHETDYSLSDFAADVRAATPTAAAELSVPDIRDLKERLIEREYRLLSLLKRMIEKQQMALNQNKERLILKAPKRYIEQQQEKTDYFNARLDKAFFHFILAQKNQFQILKQKLFHCSPKQKLTSQKQALHHLTQRLNRVTVDHLKEKQLKLLYQIESLEHLSPLNLLKRGYGVTYKNGKIIKDIKQINLGDEVKVSINGGYYIASVTAKEETNKWQQKSRPLKKQ